MQQVLDGLLRMVHHLPDLVQADLHTYLQIFAARFKLKQTILPMALLLSLQTQRTTPSTSQALRGQEGRLLSRYPRPSSGSGGVFEIIPDRPRDNMTS
jgi:hypothetical protein